MPANAPLTLTIDLSELPLRDSYRVEIVDAAGRPEFQQTLVPDKGRLVAKTGRTLPAGRHWVRLYTSNEPDNPLREYGVTSE
ncbi:MAG: hypothetical protein LLG20_26855 [Acidobacteriales bacterium]|nr:hypothetical protein [Terriglobales bacterium]